MTDIKESARKFQTQERNRHYDFKLEGTIRNRRSADAGKELRRKVCAVCRAGKGSGAAESVWKAAKGRAGAL